MREAKHVVRNEQTRNTYKILVGKRDGKRLFGGLGLTYLT